MVVQNDKNKARREFAAQFNAALTEIGAPEGRGRIRWISRRLRKDGRNLVSEQQIRKYVHGIDMPTQATLWTICERLEIDWWRFGPLRSPVNAITAIWNNLNAEGRAKLMEFAQFLLGKYRRDVDPDPKKMSNA